MLRRATTGGGYYLVRPIAAIGPWIDAYDTELFAACCGDHLVISFRVTEMSGPLTDLPTDLDGDTNPFMHYPHARDRNVGPRSIPARTREVFLGEGIDMSETLRLPRAREPSASLPIARSRAVAVAREAFTSEASWTTEVCGDGVQTTLRPCLEKFAHLRRANAGRL